MKSREEKNEYQKKYYRSHYKPHPLQIKSTVERFFSKVRIDDTTDCWLWTTYKDKDGYGTFLIKDKLYKAHRFSYENLYGPIPEGMLVCHHCDNPSCVNPFHLFLGTHKDNIQDMWRKGRANKYKKGSNIPRAIKIRNPKLSECDVHSIRVDSRSGSTLARIYNVTRTTIYDIKNKKSWNWLV